MSRIGRLLVAVLALAAFSLGSPSVEAKSKKEQGITVRRQIEPMYPAWAYNHGVSKGYAKIAFYVDEHGEISELLPIEYSHLAFAEELMTTVQKWEFRPARKQGKAIRSVCHAYWEFLPDRPIETNALFDTSKRMDGESGGEPRELKYCEDSELDARIGMLSFPGLVLQKGTVQTEEGLDRVRARVSLFVNQRGEVALPHVVDSTHPELNAKLEAALKRAGFAIPTCEGEAVLALLERTYDFPVVWTEEPVPEAL
ncbi:energy transducer TonB [Pelagicoccus mobilis]|uniref:TonB family protein n=1 Tax=Pelagicoccus mobilis TaxID=415221 RepID=A0A934RY16_9BACT|nr:hypothetical protein [Pelagicoccus mobilis]MBK1877334.1 hypothetical protein [Pelagicoccus mobilis]